MAGFKHVKRKSLKKGESESSTEISVSVACLLILSMLAVVLVLLRVPEVIDRSDFLAAMGSYILRHFR